MNIQCISVLERWSFNIRLAIPYFFLGLGHLAFHLSMFGLFLVQFWELAQEGPLPGNFTQFRSLSLC